MIVFYLIKMFLLLAKKKLEWNIGATILLLLLQQIASLFMSIILIAVVMVILNVMRDLVRIFIPQNNMTNVHMHLLISDHL